jgi:hypothetical protein
LRADSINRGTDHRCHLMKNAKSAMLKISNCSKLGNNYRRPQ